MVNLGNAVYNYRINVRRNVMEEIVYEYPKTEFIRKKVDHEGTEVIQVSLYSVVIDHQLGEPIEVYMRGYYPHKGEKNFHSEFAFSQIFHKQCAVAYLTGFHPDDMEYND